MSDSISVIKDKLTVMSIKNTSDWNSITESKYSYSVRIQVATTPPYEAEAEEELTGEQKSFWYEVKATTSFVRRQSRLSRHRSLCLLTVWGGVVGLSLPARCSGDVERHTIGQKLSSPSTCTYVDLPEGGTKRSVFTLHKISDYTL